MAKVKKQSIAELIEPYAGEWVALTESQSAIVAHSRNLKTALKKAHKNGVKCPHIVKSPIEAAIFVPCHVYF